MMLILRQKPFQFCTPCLKTPQPVMPYAGLMAQLERIQGQRCHKSESIPQQTTRQLFSTMNLHVQKISNLIWFKKYEKFCVLGVIKVKCSLFSLGLPMIKSTVPQFNTFRKKWYFVTKIVLTYFEKKCSSDPKKVLKFVAEGREFAKYLRSLEQFIQTVKDQNNIW